MSSTGAGGTQHQHTDAKRLDTVYDRSLICPPWQFNLNSDATPPFHFQNLLCSRSSFTRQSTFENRDELKRARFQRTMAPPQALSLEKQFRFYKFYHANTINKRIHMVFVPVLIVSFLAIASKVPVPGLSVDLSVVITAGYVIYSLALNVFLGLCFTPFLLAAYLASTTFCKYAGAGTVPWALTLNFAGWVAQFVGHFTFEGKSPALFDSLVNSLLAAPIVIWLEAMFAVGLFKETKARLMRSYVASKAKKAANKADKTT